MSLQDFIIIYIVISSWWLPGGENRSHAVYFNCIFFSLGASDMLILCLELIRGRLGVMSAEIRKLFFIILTTLIEKSPVSITQLHYLFLGQGSKSFPLEPRHWKTREITRLESKVLVALWGPEWVTNKRQINSKHEKNNPLPEQLTSLYGTRNTVNSYKLRGKNDILLVWHNIELGRNSVRCRVSYGMECHH